MQDQDKTRDQLIDELNELRRSFAELDVVQNPLTENESRYRQIIDKSNEAIFVLQDGRVQFANEKSSEIVGYSIEDILFADAIATFVYPEDREMVLQHHSRRLQGDEEFYQYDFRIARKDGDVRWLDVNPSMIMWQGKPGVLCLVTDITDRKRLEEELRVSEEKFSKAFLLSPDAISITRLVDGKFVSVNAGVERLLGYPEAEVIGKTSKELNVWHDLGDRDRLVECLKAEGKVENFEARYCTKDGQIRYGLMSNSIITLNGVEHILNVTRDITDQKHAADELHRALVVADHLRTRAEAASVAKSGFLANMSHELRTPLTSIIGFSELLSDKRLGNLNDKQRGYVTEITGAGHHLLGLISDILDLAKLESGKMDLKTTSVDLNQLMESAFTMVKQDAFKRGIKIALEIAEEFRRQNVWVDAVKLKQIVVNLLDNAIKFTPLGGEIKLEAQTRDHEIMISVSDSGVGIKPEDQERIFEEFEQVDSSRSRREQGTGLGLALARRLVELHGGHISVESEGDNKGSVFTFAIPLVLTCDEYRESGSIISGPESATQCSHADILSANPTVPGF
jgi:PAS domain S-box-containing protein